jgi:hypothetical protein
MKWKGKNKQVLLATSSKQSETIDTLGENTHTRYSNRHHCQNHPSLTNHSFEYKAKNLEGQRAYIAPPTSRIRSQTKDPAKDALAEALKWQGSDAQYAMSNLSDRDTKFPQR